MVLPYIKMNPPQVYMCSPFWTPLPLPSPYHPSGSSQCTSPKHPILWISVFLNAQTWCFLGTLSSFLGERFLWLFVLVLFLKKYLFVYLVASGLHCVVWVLSLRCMDSLVVAHVHQSWGSVVRAHGLSCSAACGILVPRPGIKPTSPALQGRFLTTGPPPEYLHH